MPGFTTHYLFGCESVNFIKDKELKNIIKSNKKVYGIGLQGPDIFFFSPYSFTNNKRRIGSVMHVYDTGKFLRNLISEVRNFNGYRKDIAIAYISGFLGHYSLDTVCHPYIYYSTGYEKKSSEYFGKHVDFETNIDRLLLKELKSADVLKFRHDATVALDKKEIDVIAELLNNACKKTYPYILSSKLLMKFVLSNFRYANSMLRDKAGKKKKVLSILENAVLKHPFASPLFVHDGKNCVWEDPLNKKHNVWKNPWKLEKESEASFNELMHEAREYYIEVLEYLNSYFVKDIDTNEAYSRLCRAIGNNSYHSGLDCSIPS